MCTKGRDFALLVTRVFVLRLTSVPSQSQLLMEHPVTICMLSPPSSLEDLCLQRSFLRDRHQILEVKNLFQIAANKTLPVPSMISVVGSTSYEQGSPGAGPDSSSARAGRDTWLELSTCPEPRGCPFSKAPSSFGMESSPSVHSWKKAEWQEKTHK